MAAYQLGQPFKTVTITPGKDTFGCVRFRDFPAWFRPDIEVTERMRVVVRDRVTIWLAGAEAEDAYCHEVSDTPEDWNTRLAVGADRDFRNADDLALHVTSSDDEAEAYIAWLSERASNLVGPEGPFSPLVHRLADELERTQRMSWRKVRDFMTAPRAEAGDS